MANEVQTLLLKYESDISPLVSQGEALAQEFRKMTAAAETSSKAVEQTLNKQAALISSIISRLAVLQKARDDSNGDPARVERITALMVEQQERLVEIRSLPPLQIIAPEQLGIVEQARKSIQELTIARDKSTDLDKQNLLSQLLAEQEATYRKMITIPKFEPFPPAQLGILEQARQKLEELRVAQLKNTDPAQIQQYIQSLREQEEVVRKLIELPPVEVVPPAQLGLIEQVRSSIEQLTIARDKSLDTTEQDVLNKKLGEQRYLLEQMTAIPPAKPVDPAQLGIIENLRKRIEQLTVARDKLSGPDAQGKINRINGLLDQQGTRLKNLQGIKPPAALDANKNNILGNSFDSLGRKIVAVFAVDSVLRFGNAAVEAFAKAQASAQQLLGALNGNIAAQENLLEFSKDFSVRFAIPDDVINSQSAFLAIQGRTEAQIKKTIEAAIELSAVIPGQDLAASVSQLSATFEGNIGRLGKLDKAFDSLSQEQRANGAAVDLILEKYRGFAEKGLEGVQGQLRRTQIEIAQTTQKFGEQIAPLKIFVGDFTDVWLKGLGAMFEGAKDLFDKNKSIFANPFNLFRKGTTDQEDKDNVKKEIDTQTAFALKAFRGASVQILNEQIKSDEDLLNQNKLGFRKDSESKLLFYRARLIALNQLLSDIQKAEDDAAKKRIETEESVQLKIQNLQSELSKVENPRTTGSARAAALRRQIKEQQAILEEITGKSEQELLNSRKAASEKLAELDKKINEDLLRAKGQDSLELLAIEKQIAEQELQVTFDASQKTIKDRQNLNDALIKLAQEFGIKEREIIFKNEQEKAKQREESANTEIEQAKARFEATKTNLDTQEQIQIVDVRQKFTDAGDFSPQAIESRDREIFEIEQKFNALRLADQKKFTDEFVKLNEAIFLSKQKTAQLEINKVESDLFAGGVSLTGLPDPIKAKEAADKIAKINSDLELERQRLGLQTTAVLNDAQNAQTQNLIDNLEEQDRIKQSSFDKQKELEDQIKDTIINGTQEIITESIRAQSEERIEGIEAARDAQIDAIDAELKANEDARKKGVIGRKEFEDVNKRLLDERKAAEEKSAAAINKIKRQQFQADQIAAIAKIAIAALVAAAEAGFNPVLDALYAGLAAIEIGLVLARPNPYKYGTKDAPRHDGLSMVGEEGVELMYMPQHSKVLPHGKTKEKNNASLIDAMFDGNVEKHIQKTYIDPALKEQMQEFMTRKNIEVYESLGHKELQSILSGLQISGRLKAADNQYRIGQNNHFATTIANTFILSHNGMNIKDAEKIRRRGTSIKNSKEIAMEIAEQIKKVLPDTNKRRYS